MRIVRTCPRCLKCSYQDFAPYTGIGAQHWQGVEARRYWRWKSRSRGGRPPIDAELRALIREMSVDNPLWRASRIHGELLKLDFEVAESSVAKYMRL
jgi:hypothetical protein